MDRQLKLGHYLKGPEPTGCFNSGVAPAIARSRLAKEYLGKEYAVGKDLDVTFNLNDNILMVMRGKRVKVSFYKSKARAFNHFEKLVDKMMTGIREDVSRIKELRRKAQAGDMGAVLALNDY